MQMIFYSVVFFFGFIYQPIWIVNNFWLKADFYEVLPFQFPYLAFLFLYSTLSTIFIWFSVEFIKKYIRMRT